MMEVKASMAGSMWKLLVKEGEKVEKNQDVAILESMKMEIPLQTEREGTVKAIKVDEGEFINEGETILVIE